MKFRIWSVLCLILTPLLRAQSAPPSLVLEGTVTSAQDKTYLDVPFQVPDGIHRISVDFSYTGHEQHTTIDLGIADPYRFRGASGGNKSHFTISEADATPSYLPGEIPPGRWKLLLSVPNIRTGVLAHYHAEIRFNDPAEDHSFASQPLAHGQRWYRGDLHVHTAHSDGSCISQTGTRVPCPVFLTVQAAATRNLDFIAVSDHNTTSQFDSLRELQPYFDKVLLIPAREITTFWGHLNVLGTTQFIDYRTQNLNGRDINALLQDVRSNGAIASINHGDAPSGESCMGCGWTPPSEVDMSLFTGIEVINGGSMLFSSANLWDKQIAAGHHLTAIGGSDNHNALIPPGQPGAIGRPTTVVAAEELSVPALLNAIRQGRVFIDLTSSHDKLLDMEASTGSSHARMGEDLTASNGMPVQINMHVAACTGTQVHLLIDGQESPTLAPIDIAGSDETLHAQWLASSGRHWLRPEVRDAQGQLLLLGNPIYINFPSRQQPQ